MPDFSFENQYRGFVAGIDEAGRGPWAGPVIAGAVVFLNKNCHPVLLSELNDSKKLSKKKREKLYNLLLDEAQNGHLLYGIGSADASEIDRLNILQATFLAMRRALEALPQKPDFALIDGNRAPADFPAQVQTIIGGDGKSLSVAAASILAKVYRDRLMTKLALQYPYYGFEKNAGYGTKAHIEGLLKYGVCPEHRKTYRPVAEVLQQAS